MEKGEDKNENTIENHVAFIEQQFQQASNDFNHFSELAKKAKDQMLKCQGALEAFQTFIENKNDDSNQD